MIYTYSSAEISDCGKYRYMLWREWGDDPQNKALFIGLNPSTADGESDDPTIRRCVSFAQKFGCDALTMANLFAYRATDSAELSKVEDPVGPDNDKWLRNFGMTATIIVAAWGAFPVGDRAAEVLEMLPQVLCLGKTKSGAPRHPLYLRKDAASQLLSGATYERV